MASTPVTMRRLSLDGVELEYEDRGSGEPVVLIHGSAIKDDLLPVADQLALKGYRVIRYHRRGYGSSNIAPGPISIGDQSRDCAGLLNELDVERAHVVGHSYGGVIALQLALDAPGIVHSLSLLEPALILVVPSGQAMMQQMTPVIEMYQRGEKQQAAAAFIQAISRPNAQQIIDAAIPGAYADSLTMSDMFFATEMPALEQWPFNLEQIGGIQQPVLFVIGDESPAPFGEAQHLLATALPQMVTATIAGGTHIHDIEKPGPTAEAIASFLQVNPMVGVMTDR
ncbi:MAG TPA: alpha/beta hydrolase [Candidatus Dormibacteraeota bacterium]|jgi:pimeloyl-ACP methyl ester carboxylesterase|nr:alpha/beta hydrolase [Candidatus Dormibacteraeota bacterium]